MKLIDLLAQKHSTDVFVPECKDGPTHGASHVRLDAWVLSSSWAHPCVTGYEIKISRSDFLQDQKWPSYLDLCNQLYFVCPTGLIAPTELPAEVGLMWVSKTGTRLYTKKKAPHRNVTIPEDVYRYVLMCRARITRENLPADKRAFWERWLEDRNADDDFGRMVGGRIAKHYAENVLRVETENERLKALVAGYADVRKFMESLGLNPDSSWDANRWKIEGKLEEQRFGIPRRLRGQLEALFRAADDARKYMDQITAETTGGTQS